MWRDILIILAFVFSVFSVFHYFGLTPGRISGYAKTAKAEVTKRTLFQRVLLILAIVASLAVIYMFAGRFAEYPLAFALRAMAAVGALWTITIAVFWGLREKWGETAFIVANLVFVSLFIVGYAFSDMTLLEKVTYPTATFGVAFGIAAVKAYIERRRADRRSYKEGDK
jgi:4-amino-4-deoxy-L-arabinose transferase-like glycosyltransferase